MSIVARGAPCLALFETWGFSSTLCGLRVPRLEGRAFADFHLEHFDNGLAGVRKSPTSRNPREVGHPKVLVWFRDILGRRSGPPAEVDKMFSKLDMEMRVNFWLSYGWAEFCKIATSDQCPKKPQRCTPSPRTTNAMETEKKNCE